jgi:hypothetical protein
LHVDTLLTTRVEKSPGEEPTASKPFTSAGVCYLKLLPLSASAAAAAAAVCVM